MKRLAALALCGALLALASACAGDTTNSNANLANSNRAANANNANAGNANAANVNTANSNRNDYDPNLTEADYDRKKDEFSRKAKDAGDTVGTGLKDGWIHFKTKAALLAADDLRDSTINVDTDNGAITLRGSVASAAQKTKAETVAKGIDGVNGVKNQLTVKADAGAANANNANHKGGTH